MIRCLLGKSGDICSFLPLLWHEAKSGTTPRLMVSKQYASLLEGVSYVDPIIFDGDCLAIDAAMTQAKEMDKSAVCVQIAGSLEDVRKWVYINGQASAVCESFEKEMWRLAGVLPLWREQFPLVFDRRNPEREAALLPDCMKPRRGRKSKVMLIHTDGKTSPFPYAKLLWRFLALAFPTWEMVDLGKVKCERIFDLLGLYEKADLLVACDSAPLHLARAVPGLAVVALTKDTPSLWHGTAWRPQHIAYCRYGDFPKRAVDVEHRIRIAFDGAKRESDVVSPRIIHTFSEYDV